MKLSHKCEFHKNIFPRRYYVLFYCCIIKIMLDVLVGIVTGEELAIVKRKNKQMKKSNLVLP